MATSYMRCFFLHFSSKLSFSNAIFLWFRSKAFGRCCVFCLLPAQLLALHVDLPTPFIQGPPYYQKTLLSDQKKIVAHPQERSSEDIFRRSKFKAHVYRCPGGAVACPGPEIENGTIMANRYTGRPCLILRHSPFQSSLLSAEMMQVRTWLHRAGMCALREELGAWTVNTHLY